MPGSRFLGATPPFNDNVAVPVAIGRAGQLSVS